MNSLKTSIGTLWLQLPVIISELLGIPYFVLQPAALRVRMGCNTVVAAVDLLQSFRVCD